HLIRVHFRCHSLSDRATPRWLNSGREEQAEREVFPAPGSPRFERPLPRQWVGSAILAPSTSERGGWYWRTTSTSTETVTTGLASDRTANAPPCEQTLSKVRTMRCATSWLRAAAARSPSMESMGGSATRTRSLQRTTRAKLEDESSVGCRQ